MIKKKVYRPRFFKNWVFFILLPITGLSFIIIYFEGISGYIKLFNSDFITPFKVFLISYLIIFSLTWFIFERSRAIFKDNYMIIIYGLKRYKIQYEEIKYIKIEDYAVPFSKTSRLFKKGIVFYTNTKLSGKAGFLYFDYGKKKLEELVILVKSKNERIKLYDVVL